MGININDALVELKPECRGGMEIAVLTNSVYYFIQSVFIIKSNGSYRLIATHNDELLIDETYHSGKGAKIAFLKLYWYRAWADGVKPTWTHFFPPEMEWIEKRTKLKKTA